MSIIKEGGKIDYSQPTETMSDNNEQKVNEPNDLGVCMENRCNEKATKDYNGHKHYVCDYHYRRLNDEFDEEYR